MKLRPRRRRCALVRPTRAVGAAGIHVAATREVHLSLTPRCTVLQLRKVLDKYESDMTELVKRDEQWMLQTLQQHKEEAATYMDRTDSSLRTLRDETAGQTTARDVVERMERDVDTLTENLKRLPVRDPKRSTFHAGGEAPQCGPKFS